MWRQWIQTVLGLTVILALLEILLPSGELGKFSKLVLGLVLMLAVLQPLPVVLEQKFNTEDISWLQSELPSIDLPRLATQIKLAGTKPLFVAEPETQKQLEELLRQNADLDRVQVEIAQVGGFQSVILRIEPYDSIHRRLVTNVASGVLQLDKEHILVETLQKDGM